MTKLEQTDRELMLRGAHAIAKLSELRGVPLWSFVGQITSWGSTSSCEICRELGWDPCAPANKPLPPWSGRRPFPDAGADYVPRAEVDTLAGKPPVVVKCPDGSAYCCSATKGQIRRATMAFARAALPPDAGAELLTKEQVRPLVEALEGVLRSAIHPDIAVRTIMVPLDPIRNALAHARSLGF